jgi:hypothetical protein
LDDRYRKSESVVSREIAGEVILVPIRRNVGDLESIYTFNETASRIWALIDGQHTAREIRDQIVAEFEVEADEAGQDLSELLSQLASIQAVEKV